MVAAAACDSTPEALGIDTPVVRFRRVFEKLGLSSVRERSFAPATSESSSAASISGAGGEIVETAELILKVFHRLDESSMAFGFRLAPVKRFEELRRIAQFFRGDAQFMAGLVIGIDEIFACARYQNLSNTPEAKSLAD